jgi:transcriptional regulator with XRE-family HTH domain
MEKGGDIMNKRIKLIREEKELTQDEFGKKIGSARNTIANYENGNRNPSNAVITSICREFNVNEIWLRTGEGEMFLPMDRETELARLTVDLFTEESTSFKNRFVSLLARMSDEEWTLLENMVEKLAKKE